MNFADIDDLYRRLVATDSPLRIFGYGSLIWLPNFAYATRTVGWIAGYKRRFYQGSASHRGTALRPGRVATLVPTDRPGAVTCGVAFEIRGADAIRSALEHLTEREMKLGGYQFHRVSFHPFSQAEQQEAYMYIADPSNSLYLGKASLRVQARQVASATGPAGANVDYVRGVADFMLSEVPDGRQRDPHVFELLRLVEAFLLEDSLSSESSESLLSEESETESQIAQRTASRAIGACGGSEKWLRFPLLLLLHATLMALLIETDRKAESTKTATMSPVLRLKVTVQSAFIAAF